MIDKHFRLTFLIFVLLSIPHGGYAQSTYTSNPGRGYMTRNESYIQTLSGENDAMPSTQFMYTYLNAILTDDCLNDDGSVIDSVLYNTIKSYYDAKLDFDGNIRYVLRVFPTCCSSGPGYSPYLVFDKFTDDGKMLIWYPPKLHKVLMDSPFPTRSYRRDIDKFKDTKNLSIVDFRSDVFYNVYRHVLYYFSKYLNENIERKDIFGKPLKRGDFISCIEIAFLGPYGEGWNTFYDDYEDSRSFFRMTELYKEYLSDYLLIAPGFGMRTNTTTNPKLKDFQYYLMTTTYGKGKEFGLSIDHLGTQDYLKDFNIEFDGIDFRQLAREKYKKAPFVGENSGGFIKESTLITQCLREYKISMCDPWGKLELDESAIIEWNKASKMMGYVFSVVNSQCNIKKRRLEANFHIQNKGVSFCYWDYWLPEIIIRDAETGNEIASIDISKYLDLSKPQYSFEVKLKKKVIPRKQFRANPNAKYEVFLRVVDKKGIAEPLEFDNMGRRFVLL